MLHIFKKLLEPYEVSDEVVARIVFSWEFQNKLKEIEKKYSRKHQEHFDLT